MTARLINKNQDYVDSEYYSIALYDTFSDNIYCDTLAKIEDLTNDYLSDNGINSKVLGGCIINVSYQFWPHSIFCIFTDSGMYFEFVDDYDKDYLYNTTEFKDKFSIKWEWGKFVYNNVYIKSIEPIGITNGTYISLREFLEFMGCDVGWDEEKRKITFKYNGNEYQSKRNILSDFYNVATGDKIFERTWTPAYSGVNLNGKLYYSIDEVNLFANKVFKRKLSVDYNDKVVYCG